MVVECRGEDEVAMNSVDGFDRFDGEVVGWLIESQDMGSENVPSRYVPPAQEPVKRDTRISVTKRSWLVLLRDRLS